MEMKTVKDGRRRRRAAQVAALLVGLAAPGSAQDTAAVRAVNDSVTVRFVDADMRAVIQALGRYLPKPVLVGNVQPVRVSLETPGPVSRATLPTLLKGLAESHNLEFIEEPGFFRVAPRAAEVAFRPPPGAGVGQGAAVQLFVVRLKHARAADVAATVNLLFGGGGEFSGAGGLSTGTLTDELRRNVVPAAGVQPPPAGPSAPTSVRQASLTGAVTIVPDGITNALLIRASKEDFDVLREAVEQLDVRPLQVLIEVLIVEARSDKSFSLGADLFVPQQPVDNGDGTAGGTVSGGGLADMVIRLLNLGNANVDATIRAAASRGNVRIISRPVVLASNNTEARLLVGDQRPFIQVSRSLPTDDPQRDQVVQYRDVGTKLTVRPTINHDGYVSLLIQQEISAATGEVQFDAPVITTREALTQVLVKDGQTLVLGGLRGQQRESTQRGVPILSAIPILGGLFGSADRRTTETELYLFLTPRIIRTDAEADSVTAPKLPKDL